MNEPKLHFNKAGGDFRAFEMTTKSKGPPVNATLQVAPWIFGEHEATKNGHLSHSDAPLVAKEKRREGVSRRFHLLDLSTNSCTKRQ